MGGYTKDINDLLLALDKAKDLLFTEGFDDLSDAVEEARARLEHIASHINIKSDIV